MGRVINGELFGEVERSKRCNGCHKLLPLGEFYVRRSGRYDTKCKACHGAYYKEHKAECLERSRKYREEHPEYFEQYREQNREKLLKRAREQWAEGSKDTEVVVRRRAARKERYQKDPEKSRATRKAWRDANPEKVREGKRRYRELRGDDIREREREQKRWRYKLLKESDPVGYTAKRLEISELRFQKRWDAGSDEIIDLGRYHEIRYWERIWGKRDREYRRKSDELLIRLGLKRCSKCGRFLGLGLFYVEEGSYLGYSSQCRGCIKLLSKHNRLKHGSERSKRRRAAQAKGLKYCFSCERELGLDKFYKAHGSGDGLEGICIECHKERHKEWRDSHKGRIREQNRFARINRAEADRVEFDIDAWLEAQRPLRCYLCGEDVGEGGKFHIEHRIPLGRGGKHAPWNLGIACPGCNHSKRDKTPWEYMPEKFDPMLQF